MFGLPIGLLVDGFLIAGAASAFWKGGRGERAAALVVVANVVAGRLGQELLSEGAQDLVRLSIDGTSALALLFITIRYGSLWLGGVMLFFAAQFALFSFYIVTARDPDFLKALINNLNWGGVTWCLIIGTIVAWRRRLKTRRAREAAAALP